MEITLSACKSNALVKDAPKRNKRDEFKKFN